MHGICYGILIYEVFFHNELNFEKINHATILQIFQFMKEVLLNLNFTRRMILNSVFSEN